MNIYGISIIQLTKLTKILYWQKLDLQCRIEFYLFLTNSISYNKFYKSMIIVGSSLPAEQNLKIFSRSHKNWKTSHSAVVVLDETIGYVDHCTNGVMIGGRHGASQRLLEHEEGVVDHGWRKTALLHNIHLHRHLERVLEENRFQLQVVAYEAVQRLTESATVQRTLYLLCSRHPVLVALASEKNVG